MIETTDPALLAELEREGVVVLPGLLPDTEASGLARSIDRLADAEMGEFGCEPTPNNGYYVRDLIWKDERFHPFLRWEPTLALARAMLGDRLRVDINARVAFEGVGGAHLTWHAHQPAPTEVRPWASDPHSMSCLVYLDDVGPDEGALLVLPGSHLDPSTTEEAAREQSEAGAAQSIWPRAGDVVVLHGATWHATEPSTVHCDRRRILFLGYCAAWMVLDVEVGGQPGTVPTPVAQIRWPAGQQPSEREERDLLGRFTW